MVSATTVCTGAPPEPAKAPPKPSALSLTLAHIITSQSLGPPLKYSSLPEGGALPLPDRHVVHSFGEGGISAAHGHSCGHKEQQPKRHDHEALPGQEQVPTDPHPRQPQLPRTPAAARHTPPGRAQEVGGVEDEDGAQGPSSELAAIERRGQEESAQTPPSLRFLPQTQPQRSSLGEPVSTEHVPRGLPRCCFGRGRWPRRGKLKAGAKVWARLRSPFFPLTVHTWHFGVE